MSQLSIVVHEYRRPVVFKPKDENMYFVSTFVKRGEHLPHLGVFLEIAETNISSKRVSSRMAATKLICARATGIRCDNVEFPLGIFPEQLACSLS